ncbi:hypothetical protein ACIPW5_37885 [Streptomyces sp. NPDC090077]|uniref:hypothetical protein n=1 Tax=Streptomyces sp. NPDC090077 TaxID=3365938 RepID=UPI0038179188
MHTVGLDGWPDAADQPDPGAMSCGTVLDYRSAEQRLQSHADLWLTSLTGVDPAAHDGWAAVLDEVDRVMLAGVGEAAAAGEDSALQNMLVFMDVGRRAAARGDLRVAATSLAYCETFAQGL